MHVVEIMALPRSLPLDLMDGVLTATEQALLGAGATRVWVQRGDHNLTVMAEVPTDDAAGAVT